jgi:hypothetical protein
MKNTILFLLFISIFTFQSCEELLNDTDLNPIYYVECNIDNDSFRAQTNKNAWLIWFAHIGDEYEVIGQDTPNDMQINLTLFGQLGEATIQAGTEVNTYLTNIVYFHDDKTYSALESGGSGFVTVESLSDSETTGTFQATLVNTKDISDVKKITNGKFYVKTRN